MNGAAALDGMCVEASKIVILDAVNVTRTKEVIKFLQLIFLFRRICPYSSIF